MLSVPVPPEPTMKRLPELSSAKEPPEMLTVPLALVLLRPMAIQFVDQTAPAVCVQLATTCSPTHNSAPSKKVPPETFTLPKLFTFCPTWKLPRPITVPPETFRLPTAVPALPT